MESAHHQSLSFPLFTLFLKIFLMPDRGKYSLVQDLILLAAAVCLMPPESFMQAWLSFSLITYPIVECLPLLSRALCPRPAPKWGGEGASQ